MRQTTLMRLTGYIAVAVVALAGAGCADPSPSADKPSPAVAKEISELTTVQKSDPPRTVVTGPNGVQVATLTEGARTVVFNGPQRTFTEQGVRATITTTAWVRVAPIPWQAQAWRDPSFQTWLVKQIGNLDTDVLAAAAEYITGAVNDAEFGLDRSAGADGADFYDFLGRDWTFPDGKTAQPDPKWKGHLDCSGYLRLIYGFRMGITPYNVNRPVDGLPRTSWGIAANAPQATIAAGATPADAPTDLTAVQPGDLVFFALRSADNISHSGIYLGKDDQGAMRFVSARGTAGGPTFGDVKGASVIDSGYFGGHLRRVIRL